MDLNCDLGESYGAFRMGNDEAILPYVDSVNIACGYHAGDPTIMQTTVKLAKEHGVKIGAHPGFPDLHGFGRRNLQLSPHEIYDMVLYQLGALHAFTVVNETTIHHVKKEPYRVLCDPRTISIRFTPASESSERSIPLLFEEGSLIFTPSIITAKWLPFVFRKNPLWTDPGVCRSPTTCTLCCSANIPATPG